MRHSKTMWKRATLLAGALGLAACCASLTTADAACEEAQRACADDAKACDAIDNACSEVRREQGRERWEMVEDALSEPCDAGKESACRTLIDFYATGPLRQDYSADKRERAVARGCSLFPEHLCTLVPESGFPHERLERAELVMACEAEPARRCAGKALVDTLRGRSKAKGLGPKSQAWIDARCFDGEAPACEAAFARFEGGTTGGADLVAFLMKSCPQHEPHCHRLASACRGVGASCDEARKVLEASCRSAECLGELSRRDPDGYAFAACAAGHTSSCETIASRIRHDEAATQAASYEARCADQPPSCWRGAGAIFTAARDYPRAVGFLKRACDADDARACNMLPYVALELDPPLNANARRELDARCNEADPKACLRLADVYKWGVGGVIRNAAKSADYAKRVCDAPGDPDAPWKKVACAWNPKPPTPDVGTFAGSGSASGNSALRGIGTVLTLPFSIFF